MAAIAGSRAGVEHGEGSAAPFTTISTALAIGERNAARRRRARPVALIVKGNTVSACKWDVVRERLSTLCVSRLLASG